LAELSLEGQMGMLQVLVRLNITPRISSIAIISTARLGNATGSHVHAYESMRSGNPVNGYSNSTGQVIQHKSGSGRSKISYLIVDLEAVHTKLHLIYDAQPVEQHGVKYIFTS
jgi:hypothetical protein